MLRNKRLPILAVVAVQELYSVHPFRYFSVGQKLLGGGPGCDAVRRDLAPALNCLVEGKKIRATCGNGNGPQPPQPPFAG